MIWNTDPKMLKVLFNAASGHKVYVSIAPIAASQ